VKADATSTTFFSLKEAGRPVEPVYATEGSPLIIGRTGFSKPRPIRMRQDCFSRSASAGTPSSSSSMSAAALAHPQTQEKLGRKPFKDIKTMKDDAVAVEK